MGKEGRLDILEVAPPYFALTQDFQRPQAVEKLVIALCRGLAQRGHRVTLLAPPGTVLPEVHEVINYSFPPVDEIAGTREYLQLAKVAASEAVQAANQLDVDLVHFHLEGAEAFSPFLNKKSVFTVHNAPDILAYLTVPRFPRCRYAAISIHSSILLREMGARFVYVVPNDLIGIEPLLEVPRISPEEFTALFYGRVIDQKGGDLAILAAQRANVRLIIAGPRPASDQLDWWNTKVQPAIDNDPRIEYLGAIDDAGKLRVLPSVNVALFLNRRADAFGVSAGEVLGAGTDVITTTEAGGIIEVVGTRGIILPYDGDDERLVDATATAITDLAASGTSNRYRASANRDQARRFTNRMTAEYEALFREILNS